MSKENKGYRSFPIATKFEKLPKENEGDYDNNEFINFH